MNIMAPAKLNLTLDVLFRREDGYHALQMVMQSVTLADVLTVERREGGGICVETDLPYLPNNERNLAAVAAHAFQQATGQALDGCAITVQKNIPVCAGLAGGSSDAAAVLRALNTLTGAGLSPRRLAEIGQDVGSDVPYCVLGGTVLAEGRGELLTPLPPLPKCHAVLCKPDFSISTPQLFSRLDCGKIRRRPDTAGLLAALDAGDLPGVARRMYNVFENVITGRQGHEIMEIKNTLIHGGALGASLSGTGPTVFGLFDQEAAARQAAALLRERYEETFLCETV